MIEDELVSVIVPIYNMAEKLDRCIQSIVDQTYSNLEIILVDDGSTDNSKELCRKWYSNDKRIRLSDEKVNKGQAAARNIGLLMSSGQYIMFVDSDDFIEINTVEIALKSLRKNNSDICIYNFWNYDEGSKEKKRAYHYKNNGNSFLENMLFEFYPCSVCCRLIKRSVMISADDSITFPEGRRYEDTIVCFKQGLRSDNITVINTPLYYYVHNNNSTTSKPKLQDIHDLINNCNEIRELLVGKVSNEIIESYITSILAYALQVWYRVDDAPADLKEEVLGMLNTSIKKVNIITIFRNKNWKKKLLCKAGLFDKVISLKR